MGEEDVELPLDAYTFRMIHSYTHDYLLHARLIEMRLNSVVFGGAKRGNQLVVLDYDTETRNCLPSYYFNPQTSFSVFVQCHFGSSQRTVRLMTFKSVFPTSVVTVSEEHVEILRLHFLAITCLFFCYVIYVVLALGHYYTQA